MSRQSTYKRIRNAVDKRKSQIVIDYMKNNWDVVLNSSVSMIKTLSFSTRFRFAVDILIGKKKGAMRAIRGKKKYEKYDDVPGVKDTSAAPPRPDVTPPPQKPKTAPEHT